MQEKTLSNNPFFRSISDSLDQKFGWVGEEQEKSRIRGALHGLYHTFAGIGKTLYKNEEGAKCEFDRAKIQFNRMKNGKSEKKEEEKKEIKEESDINKEQ